MQTSMKVANIKQSGIRALSTACASMGGINLGQGLCDTPIHEQIKQAASQVIYDDKSLYSASEGLLELRQVITDKIARFNKIVVSTDEVIVTNGATGAFVCAILSLFNPGDEIILFEPFYGCHKNIIEFHGMIVKTVSINLNDFSINLDELTKTITQKTKGIVICNPCNPCGKIFSLAELLAIGAVAKKQGLVVISDEIYEYITYPGVEHHSFANLADHKNFTITISGLSKTYNMTGWRLGYASGPAHIIHKMASIQDLLYVCPPTPLQHAAISAFTLADDYYLEMKKTYLAKRDYTVNQLIACGFSVPIPQGAYYVLADFSNLPFDNDEQAAMFILQHAKVATVSGSNFYINPEDGKKKLRICFATDEARIKLAMETISKLPTISLNVVFNDHAPVKIAAAPISPNSRPMYCSFLRDS